MKKINLSQLLMSWNEKQTPQRFGRYAVMLIMLLTLGVGQMWALDIYLDISACTGWTNDGATIKVWPGTGSDITGSSIATNLYKFTVTSATGTMYFKRMNGSSTWNEASVTYNSSYNLYKLTGWNAAACSNANINNVTKTDYIYFDNSTTAWSNSNRYFIIGHDYPSTYSKKYSMTAIGHTKLWYVANSSDSWTDATYYGVINPTSAWGSDTNWGSSNLSNGNKYTAAYTAKRDLNSGKTVLFTPGSASNGCALTISSDMSSYTGLNYSQTVKKYTCTAEDDGSMASQFKNNTSANSGTVTISAYKMTGNGTASNSSNSATLDEASETSASVDAAYTGEVTLTASANTGYTFVGWFTNTTATTALSTNTSYTYNAPKSTKTVYARFKEDRYTVKVQTYTNGDATPKSNTYGGIATGVALTATPNTGYQFNGWTINSGSGTFGSTSTASTNFYPTSNSQLKANFTAKTITVTLNGNGGSDGSATIKYAASSLTNISHSSRSGYSLNGYYTADSGGDKVINADGSLNNVSGWVSGGYWSKATDGTLYAQWTENATPYAVTYGVHSSGHGSLSAANTSTSAAITSGNTVLSGTGVTFTASPSTGYEVEGWYSNSDCSSAIAGAGTGTTYSTTISAATTVYVKFKEKTWSVAFAAGTGGTVTTPAATPQTVGQVTGISIAATPSTGYTFNTWTITSGSGSFTSGATTNSNTFKPTAASTITASFTERKSTITVTANNTSAGTLKFSSTSKSWGSTASLGVATTQQITATAAAGFSFVRWDLSGAAASASTLTNSTITIKANGSGDAGTVTAVFAEDLTSRWHLVGESSDFPDGWNVNNTTMMQKKTGHSTESVVYLTVNVTSTAAKEFKIVDDNGASADIWYGYSNEPSYQRNWTATTTYTVYSGSGNGQNLKYTPTVTGPYEFKVDYSDADNVAVTVTFPTSYTLTYDIGTVKGNNGSISTSPSTASGSKVISGNSVQLTAPAAKTGYTWKGWYTNAAGTEGKIDDTNRAITVTMNADKTLYACYTENQYNATVSAGANGSVSPSGTVAIKQVSGTSLTATPNTGYSFSSWTISGGGITPGSSTTSPQTFKATSAGGTIQANFTENMHSVTVASNNTAFGTVSTSSVSAGIATASTTITATPVTGANFTGWTIPSGVTIVSGSTSTQSITIRATADSKSITANFTEPKYTATITTANSSRGTVSPSSASVGQITAVQITATKKSGYMFAGWEKTSGTGTVTYHVAAGTGKSVDPTGSTQATTYITITGNVTLRANWEEDRTSGWYMRGNWTNGWTTGQKEFTKDVGETAGTMSHVRWTLAPEMFTNATMQMKMYDGSDYYGHWNGDDDPSNICTKDGNNSNLTFYKDAPGDSHSNFRISIPVYGEYDFEWDSSTKQLTVHYPDGNFIRGQFNSWNWSAPMTGSGPWTATINLPADQLYATASSGTTGFKYVINGDHYGKNGTISSSSNSLSSCTTDGQNMGLATTIGGNYTFTVAAGKTQVTVTYPTIPAMTGTVGLSVSGESYSTTTLGTTTYHVFAGDVLTLTPTHSSKPDNDSHFKYTYYNGAKNSGTATTEITTIASTAASLSYNFNVGSETGTYPLKVGAYYEYGPDGYKAKGSAQESSIAKYHVHLSPAVTLTSDKVSITDGQSVTLTATPSHVDLVSALNKIKYEFFNGNSTEEGDKIGETISKSDSDAVTKTVTPDCSGHANSWTYTVKMTYLLKEVVTTITIYRKWDIYVDDVCSWGAMKLYMWDEHEATPAAFPGTALPNITGSTHWYVATLDTRYPNFKFDKQSGTESSNHTADHATYAPGTHWYLENCSTLHPVTISNPTVTISATVTNATQINLTGFVSNFGGDGSTASGLKEVYFNVNGTKDATGITASTTDGNFTKALSNPTPDNTNNTLQAAATNIVGTGTSSSLRFTKITLDKQSGSSGTTNVQAVNGVAMASGATAPTRTGYTFGGYFASTGGSGKQYYNANMTSANNWDQTDATKTLYAKWTANTYSVHFDGNGATSGEMADETGFTYDVSKALTANAFERTGYTFQGWATAPDGAKVYNDGQSVSNLTSTNGATVTLYAVWQAKTYTVNLTRTGTGYDSGGTASVTATYGAAMPAMTSPTAANGYAFMGYFTAEGGEGTQYYNANGSSAKNWDIDVDPSTLYAYFKMAQITDLTFSPSTIVATGVTVTVTPTIAPTPTGNIHVEWCILYDNGNPLPSQPTITHLANNAISFTSMSESGTYKVEAKLRLGTTEGAGTILHTFTKNFQVAGEHDVTVRYVCGDYPIQASSSVKGKPLEWTSVTAPTITGYTFTRWVAGDGITIEGVDNGALPDTATTATIRFKAIYDGTLKAEYSKKKMIFFNNTLDWEHVYVFFYNSNEYWNNTLNTSGSPFGSGAKQDEAFTDGHKPYFEGEHGEMTQIEGTNIWYFDYTAENYPDRTNITFAKDNQHNYQYFDDTEVARICDAPFNGEILPMYVPIPGVTEEYNKHDGKKVVYYTKGYWMNYPENTGYWLKVFNKKASSDAPDAGSEPVTVKDIPFTFPADFAMPMSVKVDLEAGKTYGFKIYRIDNTWYGNSGTMKDGDSGAEGSTPWEMTSGQSSNCGILTTSAGDYTFTLRYAANSGGDNFQYRVSVDYPVAVGDYRIVYKDNARWSQSTAHSAAWSHPSAVITQNSGSETKADTVSFFVSVGSSPSMKFQKVKSITAATGEVTWEDVSGGSITIPSHVIDSGKGVYNFIVSQPVGGASISLTKAEEYTGNFYIRTDCAGTTKWDNYKADDHLMTYSDYAANNEGFTHYFAHWVRRSENVKFVIANDYSPCVSDTLIRDNDYIYNNMDDAGTLYSDGNPDPTYDKYSANIRFMYNQAENKISRAYVSGSSNEGKFIIMQGASNAPMIYDKDGNALPATDKLPANAINLTDDQNFIYETNIKANAEAYIKLKAQYCDATQYFKGDDDDTFDAEHAVEILGGTYTSPDNKEKMRVIYDFKTNRLVCAWQPSDTIKSPVSINADVMIIREHQGEADQITFKGEGSKLDEVKTVYGVMRFNRWTLANKEKTGSHSPLGDPKSKAERQIYFISFPFDVNLSDIFGLGAYDDLWWIEYYDGAERASKGYFQETKTFWKFMENTKTAKLEANKGYLLKLDAEMLKSDNERVWTNNIEQVELFFPSATEMSDIEQMTAEIELAEHPCSININPAGSKEPEDDGYVAEKDRRKRDSNWNCMGVPSYANYSSTLKDKDGNDIRWSTWEVSDGPTFLYTWNPTGNSLSPTASAAYTFKTMWSYLVQASGTIKWNLASATPKSVAARRNANYKSSYMFRLELQQDGKKVEHTYVNLRDNEKVTTDFDDNFDLSNEGGAIYTTTHDLVPVAGNCLPLELEQETRVPVGVTAKTAGEYTFAMPDGTEGLSVTLVDNESGAHTNLALGDYTVELTAGTHEGRFMLVIDPRTTTTSIDVVGGEAIDEAPRKIFINGLMYIQRGSNLYDAQGRKVN